MLMEGSIEVTIDYKKVNSKLGYSVEIPKEWIDIETIDDKFFDTITIDKNSENELYNIKTQGFLIEIPKGCVELISLDKIISNMENIEDIQIYTNKSCKGKIIKSIDKANITNYTLLTAGKRGIYQFKISVNQTVEDEYIDMINYIFNSFEVI